MIIGDAQRFAIESSILTAYERLSHLALGFFTIHINGYRYGLCNPDSTMLGCSFGEVERRAAGRGTHLAPFATDSNAGLIADSVLNAIYADQHDEIYFGLQHTEFCNLVYSNHLIWAPDGDQAFDDGSYVLQFDVGDRVRLIEYKPVKSNTHDFTSLRDIWLPSDEFYGVLKQWHVDFKAEWDLRKKRSEFI